MFLTCAEEVPLSDNDLSNLQEGTSPYKDESKLRKEMENLERILRESKDINDNYEKELNELRIKLQNRYKKECEDKDRIICGLNDQIQSYSSTIDKLNSTVTWYKNECSQLREKLDYIHNDNQYLRASHQLYKGKTAKLTQKLEVVPEDHVL